MSMEKESAAFVSHWLTMLFNFTALFWVVFTIVFFILCLMIKIPNLPPILWDLMTFGKANTWGSRRTRNAIEKVFSAVPKSYFWHFYLTSMITNGFIFWVLVNKYFLGASVPQWYLTTLQKLTYYPLDTPTASHLSVLIAITLITVQGVRRLYECFFVSTYSNSTMHIAHYLLGMFFYPLTGLTVLAGGPNLSSQVPFKSVSDLLHSQLQWYHIVGVVMFIWISIHQHRANVIFASLRKSDKDTNVHKIPYGDWFEIVSCPHYLTEILIYGSLLVILGGQHLLSYGMFTFVLTNQVGCGLTSHQWYLTKFEDYPKHRRAIIPWVL